MGKKVKPVCATCGSEEVLSDAYAVWSVEDQCWDLLEAYDAKFCDTCGGECSVKWVETTEETEE
jgi:rRNA maturation endonuclease Nob1